MEEEIIFVNGRYQVNPKTPPPPLPTQLPTPRSGRNSLVKTSISSRELDFRENDSPLKPEEPIILSSSASLRPRDARRTAIGQSDLKTSPESFKTRTLDRSSSLMYYDLQLNNLSDDLDSKSVLGSSVPEGSLTDRTHKSRQSVMFRGPSEPTTPRENESNRRSTFWPGSGRGPLNRSTSIMPQIPKSANEEVKSPKAEKKLLEEKEYLDYLERAQKENFDNLQALKMIYHSGYDSLLRPIIVIVASLIPAKNVDLEKLLLFFIKVLDPVVNTEYVILYVHTNSGSENIPKFSFLRKCYGIFSRKYKKNLKAVYLLQATKLVKGVVKLFKPFLSNKFWKKLHYINEVKELYQYMNPQQVQLPIELLPSGGNSKPEIFGVPLDECMKHPMNMYTPIPLIVLNCMKYLLKNGTSVEGIFRLSGRAQRIEELKDAYNRGEVVDFSAEPDVHAIAGLLKLYFRILPDPVCCHSLYREWISAYDSNDIESTKQKLRLILKKLPETNYLTLSSLMGLLSLIKESSETTKMTAANLAICWAPNIIRPKEESLSAALVESNIVNNIVSLIISDFNFFFPASGDDYKAPS